jgi:hypothetical protein
MVIDGEVMDRHHARQSESKQGECVRGAMDERRLIAQHSERFEDLRPEDGRTRDGVAGHAQPLAATKGAQQRLDVSTDAGCAPRLERARVDRDPKRSLFWR